MTNLPHHRRYQWQFVWRIWRRPFAMAIVTLVLAFLIVMAELYLLEQNKRLSTELNHKSLIIDVHKLATLGAPSYVKTDFTEGTINVNVRKPK